MARALAARGESVIGIGHGDWDPDQRRHWGIAEWHAADVTLDALVACGGRPGAVFHCAGSGSVGFSATSPHDDYQRTVATTAAVLEFVRVCAPDAAVVYPSSAAVYGHSRRIPIGESEPVDPVSPYGIHKEMAERLCAEYARHFGLRVAAVRLFSVYGPGLRKQLLWDACGKVRRGETAFSGTGAEQRDWLHVDDAAALLVIAAKQASTQFPVVNGGTGTGVKVADVVGEIFAALQPGTVPRFSGEARRTDPVSYVADVSQARAWGWEPRRQWREGVGEYVKWFERGEA